MTKFNCEHANYSSEQIKHLIFNRTLLLLENKRIRHVKSGELLPSVLHERAKITLDSEMPEIAVKQLENSILIDAESLQEYSVEYYAPTALYYDLKRTGETDLIYQKRAVCIPNYILNALVCIELEKKSKRSEILACNGFILTEGVIRLDIDEQHASRGFIIPEFSKKTGLIYGLRIFRHPNDEKSFVLRSRQNLYLGEIFN